jgi:hypothetical protein
MNERFCFMPDDDGHWYKVNVLQRGEFEELLEKGEAGELDFEEKFGDARLNMHISNYSFTSVEEL